MFEPSSKERPEHDEASAADVVHLRDLVRRHRICWESRPEYAAVEGTPRAVGFEIELSATEFELLEFLLRHPRQVLARGQIYEQVWGYDVSLSSNSLDVFVGHLRRKLEAAGEPRLIHTVRGVGFTLRER